MLYMSFLLSSLLLCNCGFVFALVYKHKLMWRFQERNHYYFVINSEALTRVAKSANLMEQRLNLLEQKVSSLISVIHMYVAENNSLKENIEKLSKKTYAEAVVGHCIEGKSVPSAQDSDAETKSEAPRTSISSLNTITPFTCFIYYINYISYSIILGRS